MTVKDIALSCAVLLQADDIEDALKAEAEQGEVDGEQAAEGEVAGADENITESAADDPDVKALVKSINLALSEICTDGFPTARKVELTALERVIPFSAFDEHPSSVLAVSYGLATVEFTVTPFGIKTPHDGLFTVEYAVEPQEKALDDEIELPPLVGRDDITYLAARNFCLITGRTDEASIWDQRYAAEAEKKKIKRRAKLPCRAWL